MTFLVAKHGCVRSSQMFYSENSINTVSEISFDGDHTETVASAQVSNRAQHDMKVFDYPE